MTTLSSQFVSFRRSAIKPLACEPTKNTSPPAGHSVSEPILQRVAAGDSDAIRECVSRYGGLIWSLARRMFADRSEAEDAVQEVFIQLWKKADQFDSAKASENTFVGVLARRRMIDLLRRKKTRQRETNVSEVIDVGRTDIDYLERADELSLLQRSWSELAPEQQQILSLSIYDGLSYTQIAKQLSVPVGTVKTRARLGLKTLRTKYSSRSSTPVMSKKETPQ